MKIEHLKQWCSDLDHFEAFPLKHKQTNIGYEAYGYDQNNVVIGGGFGVDLERAHRVAISEIVERTTVRKVIDGKLPDTIDFKNFSSSCGFAAGFESRNTQFRSIAEAVERWTWSKWIDDQIGIFMEESPVLQNPIQEYFSSFFDRVLYYTTTIKLQTTIGGLSIESIPVHVSLGFKDDGVFPGSRANPENEAVWNHCLLESFRHLQYFRYATKNHIKTNDVFDRRTIWFGKNAKNAIRQIPKSTQTIPSRCELEFTKEVPITLDGMFVFRSLCKDYIGWHLGDENRFVY